MAKWLRQRIANPLSPVRIRVAPPIEICQQISIVAHYGDVVLKARAEKASSLSSANTVSENGRPSGWRLQTLNQSLRKYLGFIELTLFTRSIKHLSKGFNPFFKGIFCINCVTNCMKKDIQDLLPALIILFIPNT
jgi:hypothetical protein